MALVIFVAVLCRASDYETRLSMQELQNLWYTIEPFLNTIFQIGQQKYISLQKRKL